MSPSQHGFMSKKSTKINVLTITQQLIKVVDTDGQTDVSYNRCFKGLWQNGSRNSSWHSFISCSTKILTVLPSKWFSNLYSTMDIHHTNTFNNRTYLKAHILGHFYSLKEQMYQSFLFIYFLHLCYKFDSIKFKFMLLITIIIIIIIFKYDFLIRHLRKF